MEEKKVYNVGVLLANYLNKHPMEVLKGMYAGAVDVEVNLTLFPGAQGGVYDYWRSVLGSEEINEGEYARYNYQYNALNDYANIAGLDALVIALGTIRMYMRDDELAPFLDKFKGIPLIIIQEYDETRPHSYLIADNYGGMKSIVDHLLEVHEKKHVLYLGGPRNNTDAQERRRAYMESMAEHGLEVTEKMTAYGDYATSSLVHSLANQLIDDNPDVDAIVCANDEMAIAVYRVCEERGILVGKDIAVTGFDDITEGSRMKPALTTARQDGFRLGKQAMRAAVRRINEGTADTKNELEFIKIPFICRESCGCHSTLEGRSSAIGGGLNLLNGKLDEDNALFAAEMFAAITIKSTRTNYAEERCIAFFSGYINTMLGIRNKAFTEEDEVKLEEDFTQMLKDTLTEEAGAYIDWTTLYACSHAILGNEMRLENERDSLRIKHNLSEMLHRHIETMLGQVSAQQNEMLVKKYMEAPLVIQRMRANSDNWYAFFNLAINHVKSQGVKSAYLLLCEEPILNDGSGAFKCPDKLYITAQYDGSKVEVFPEHEGRMVASSEGFTNIYSDGAGHMFDVFLLFSEDTQYGVMICEIESEQVAYLHSVTMQIGVGLSYLYMKRKEAKMQQELIDTLTTLKEKNMILNTVSSIDPMTGISNRRGLMEKWIEINKAHIGEEAYVFFGDLDHLKEINDVYGHAAGDYAISNIARVLNDVIGKNGCIGRIGGDEFVGMLVCSETEARAALDNIKKELKQLNATSGKPYFVECSVGYDRFTCTEDVDMGAIVSKADTVMYVVKQSRRATVRRDAQENN